jgi:hypothetical protein
MSNLDTEQAAGAEAEHQQLLGDHDDSGELLVAQRRDAEQPHTLPGVRLVEGRRSPH